MGRRGAVLSLIAFLALWSLVGTAQQAPAKPETVQGNVLCKLDGTASGCCIGKLEKGIANVKGVKEVHIDWKAGTATIVGKKGAKVSVEDINKAIAEADKGHNHGFRVTQIKQAE